MIAFEVEVVLDGYWKDRVDAKLKAAVLADWSDTLEDWPLDQIRWGLREWRKGNPSKKPNPDHIATILKAKRGQVEVARMKARGEWQKPEPKKGKRLSAEGADAICRQYGFSPKTFGGSNQ